MRRSCVADKITFTWGYWGGILFYNYYFVNLFPFRPAMSVVFVRPPLRRLQADLHTIFSPFATLSLINLVPSGYMSMIFYADVALPWKIDASNVNACCV